MRNWKKNGYKIFIIVVFFWGGGGGEEGLLSIVYVKMVKKGSR